MFKLFLLSYFRNIIVNKRHAIVNFLGLSLAIAVIIIIALYVKNELTFDKFHKNSDRIYRLTTTLKTPGAEYHVAFANTGFAHKILEKLDGIENIACLSKTGSYVIKYQDKLFRDNNIRYSTPAVFDIFSYNIIDGNPKNMLTEPNTVVLTGSLSKKLFGDKDPVGESVLFNDVNCTVTGVIGDLPLNTDLKFTALLSSSVNGSEDLMAWNDYYSYILVNKNYSHNLQSDIDKLAEETYVPLFKAGNLNLSRTYQVQPITQVHFNTSYLADTPKGNKTTVFVFLCIACLILIIATINHINLNLSRAVNRLKEFSIRKISGSGKKNVITQLLVESVLNTLLAAFISIFFISMFLPVFNKLADTGFNENIFTNISVMITLLGVVFFIGIISGFYPSLYLLRIINSNRNFKLPVKMGFNKVSKGLVTFQFVFSIAMISLIIGVNKQIKHMENFNLGFNKEHILAIDLNSVKNSLGNLNPLRHELSSGFLTATGGGGTQLGTNGEGEWIRPVRDLVNEDGQDVQFILNMPDIDENYLNLFGIKVIEGRNFSKDHPSDYDQSIIINKAYAKIMAWNEPIGKRMYNDSKLRVIGVVDDFHYASLHNPVEPLAFRFNDKTPSYLFVKTSPSQIDHIKTTWHKYFKDALFEYKFVDDNYEVQYQKDEKQKTILGYLSLIAIFISCLGLYGLSSFYLTNRIKEIGVRRVNGAKISEILLFLNKDFVKWVFIAFIFAIPIAWYALHKWLENFAYKTSLSWWVFILSGSVALILALFTISLQSIKAATRNPVEALRYE